MEPKQKIIAEVQAPEAAYCPDLPPPTPHQIEWQWQGFLIRVSSIPAPDPKNGYSAQPQAYREMMEAAWRALAEQVQGD